MNLLSQLDLLCTTINEFGWINYLRDKTFAELAICFRLITYNLFPLIGNFRRGYFVVTEFHSAALVSGVLVLCIPTHNFMAYRAIVFLTQDSSTFHWQLWTIGQHIIMPNAAWPNYCFSTFSLISHRSNAWTSIKGISHIQVASIYEWERLDAVPRSGELKG